MVAKLVSQGLLKTEDVMNTGYVQDMERTLMRQKITKETEGRDFPSRRTARQAYQAPTVRAESTGVPGVYRYRRPRFARV